MSEEQAVAQEMRTMTKFTADHAREVGLPSPEAINYMMSVANMLVNTALVGKDMGLSKDQLLRYREMGLNPDQIMEADTKAIKANAMAKMLVGHELNPPVPPMAALQEIDIVKSKVFMRYPNLITQMEAKGYRVEEVERTHSRAAIQVTKPGQNPQLFEFTIEDAKMAGLTSSYQSGEKSQYEKRPRVMLWARVVSEAYRATGGRGGTYTPEEKHEILNSDDDREDADRRADILAGQDDALKLVKKQIQAPVVVPSSSAPPNEEEKEEVVYATDEHPAVLKDESGKLSSGKRAPRKKSDADDFGVAGFRDPEILAREALRLRQLKVIDGIEGAEPVHVAKVYLGYFDGEKVPQQAADLDRVLSLVEESIKSGKGGEMLVKDPVKMGKLIREYEHLSKSASGSRPTSDTPPSAPKQDEDPIASKYPNWNGETVQLCRAVMKKNAIAEEKLDRVLKIFKLSELPSPDLSMIFVLWMHSSDATQLYRMCSDAGKSAADMFKLVEEKMGGKISPASDSASVSKAIWSAMTEVQS